MLLRRRTSHYYIVLAEIATHSLLYHQVSRKTVTTKPLTYKDAGVDIDAGNRLVERIKPLVAATHRSEVLAGLGGFGGLFALSPDKYKNPVLVSGTDGVGTKLILARELGRHDTIGIDLVAMCVNDVVVQGAEPLFFLDYFACGQLDLDVATSVIAGIASGCTMAGAALIGGETAEMPDMYPPGEYDLAGFCVGAMEREALIDGSSIVSGDVLIGIGSSGPHSNGYSLIRKVLERTANPEIEGSPAGPLLLEPTQIYVRALLKLMQSVSLKGVAHITGGGITENVPRILGPGLQAEIAVNSWQQATVFDWLANEGGISTDEMRRTFNCGVGMVLVVDEAEVTQTLQILAGEDQKAWRLGCISDGHGEVTYV
jgi:phosphoribosylformylglycinamidine cyclo-ligase